MRLRRVRVRVSGEVVTVHRLILPLPLVLLLRVLILPQRTLQRMQTRRRVLIHPRGDLRLRARMRMGMRVGMGMGSRGLDDRPSTDGEVVPVVSAHVRVHVEFAVTAWECACERCFARRVSRCPG